MSLLVERLSAYINSTNELYLSSGAYINSTNMLYLNPNY